MFIHFVYLYKESALLYSSLSVYFISFHASYFSFPSTNFGFVCSFSSSFKYMEKLFIWIFSCFLRLVYITINFTFSTAFVVWLRFWITVFPFSFFSRWILLSLWCLQRPTGYFIKMWFSISEIYTPTFIVVSMTWT